MKIKVETYSGYKADERPVAFYIGDMKFRVVEVVDRWYDPSVDYFKVKANDGGVYILGLHRAGRLGQREQLGQEEQEDGFWELKGFYRE
jgi:hypothetical protein